MDGPIQHLLYVNYHENRSTFVANRFSELLSELELNWQHVILEGNTADNAARGLETKRMKSCDYLVTPAKMVSHWKLPRSTTDR